MPKSKAEPAPVVEAPKVGHTPGPWTATWAYKTRCVISGTGFGNVGVVAVLFTETADIDYSRQMANANALLIASAPDHHAAALSTVERLADLPGLLRRNGMAAIGSIVADELAKHAAAIAKATAAG